MLLGKKQMLTIDNVLMIFYHVWIHMNCLVIKKAHTQFYLTHVKIGSCQVKQSIQVVQTVDTN